MFGISKKDVTLIFVGAIVGGMVTGLGTLATGYIQSRDPVLQYIRNDTPPINQNDRNTSIYLVSVYNVGNKEAEGVDCVLRVPKARIVSHGINPPSIKHDYKEEGDTATIRLDLLNPGEAISVQILATSEVDLPPKPTVSVRGRGVTGKEIGAPVAASGGAQWQTNVSGLLSLLIPSIALGFSSLMFMSIYELSSRISKAISGKGSRFKVRIKCDGDDRVKVITLEGRGKSADPVVILPYKRHPVIGFSFEDFRKLGDGTHLIYGD